MCYIIVMEDSNGWIITAAVKKFREEIATRFSSLENDAKTYTTSCPQSIPLVVICTRKSRLSKR